ncbi:hypothetical protein R3P38DRAFT_2771509 [Favolaschia claudopus]|uniref:F-box domain-containing protein n=1 Tax=Favolaschia claudopus TaxID=2862362 RepID=A0AAW0CB20_9AGAR
MKTLPKELRQAIIIESLDDVEGRESFLKRKGEVALVCRDFCNVVYDTGEFWDTLFIHFRMDLKHIEHICQRAGATSRLKNLHIYTETEREPGAASLEGCVSIDKIARWASQIGAHLRPVLEQVSGIWIKSTTPYAIYLIMRRIGVKAATELKEFHCHSTYDDNDHPHFLRCVCSQQLTRFSTWRVSPAGLTPSEYRTVRKLQLFHIAFKLEWPQLRAIFENCVAVEVLEVSGVICKGFPANSRVTLPAVREFTMDIADAGAIEVASMLFMPFLFKFTVRGTRSAPWRSFTECFAPMLGSIRRCSLDAGRFTSAVADFLRTLRGVEVIDLRRGGNWLVEQLATRAGPERPQLPALDRWVVPSDLTFAEARVLLKWPGSTMQKLPAEVKQAIFTLSVQESWGRERTLNLKGELALVCKDFGQIIYNTGKFAVLHVVAALTLKTGEFWDRPFVHCRMDEAHIKHICARAEATSRPIELHISTETEDEPGGPPLAGIVPWNGGPDWALAMASYLRPVVKKAASIRIHAATPETTSRILLNVGFQFATELKHFFCHSTYPAPDDGNGLLSVNSHHLTLLSVGRVDISAMPLVSFRNLRTLSLYYISYKLQWPHLMTIFANCLSVESLEVVGVACEGEVGGGRVTLPAVREFTTDLTIPGAIEVASMIFLPSIVTLTMRGEWVQGWTPFTSAFAQTLSKVKQCCIDGEMYSPDVADFLAALHSVEVLDLRSSSAGFLRGLARAVGPHGPRHPDLVNLKYWVVSLGVTLAQVRVLLDWPGSDVRAVYAAASPPQDIIEWEEEDGVLTLTPVEDIPLL